MLKNIFIAALLAISVAGCSTSSIQTSARSLKMTQDSIIVAAEAADRMCDAGILSAAQCARSAELYAKSREVYREALEAELFFIEAKLAGDDADKYLEAKTMAVGELLDLGFKLKEIVTDER
jgi:uncharacterized OsmC-like protein